MSFARGGLAQSSVTFFALSLCFPHSRSHRMSLSCGWWSVKSYLSNWKRTGSPKFPFLRVEPLRHRMEEHGTARLVSPQTQPAVSAWPCGPAALTSRQLTPFSDCIMTPNRALTGFVFPLLYKGRDSINWHCREARRDTGASTRMIQTYKAWLTGMIWILQRAWCSCSYAYLAYLTGAPATHCAHDRADMDAYLSLDVMTKSPAAVTPVASPLRKRKKVCIHPPILHSL